MALDELRTKLYEINRLVEEARAYAAQNDLVLGVGTDKWLKGEFQGFMKTSYYDGGDIWVNSEGCSEQGYNSLGGIRQDYMILEGDD